MGAALGAGVLGWTAANRSDVAGGSGNNKGAILGAYVIWGVWIGTQLLTDFLPYTLKARAPYIRFLVIGVILEIILLYRPQGLLGEEKKVSRMLE